MIHRFIDWIVIWIAYPILFLMYVLLFPFLYLYCRLTARKCPYCGEMYCTELIGEDSLHDIVYESEDPQDRQPGLERVVHSYYEIWQCWKCKRHWEVEAQWDNLLQIIK